MNLNKSVLSISVCMATYNGEKYLTDQLDTILNQLDVSDEVIIVDDCSTDNTIEIINSYRDNRIRLYRNEINRGHVYSFYRALQETRNDFIFLSDQDDLWVNGRVSIMKHSLIQNENKILSSNFNILLDNNISEVSKKGILKKTDSNKHLNNIISLFLAKRNYYGCAMAFNKTALKFLLPFPSHIQSHDLWIAIVANVFKTNIHLSTVTVTRRIHGENLSEKKRSLYKKLKTRFILCNLVLIALYRRFISISQ